MKKILAIGGSNSKKSINKIFAAHIANQIDGAEVTVADWKDLELPLFSPDLEAENGVPENASNFKSAIEGADAIVISLAEYNGLPSSAFKNLWDWTSRIDQKIWADKPIFLAATSPGGRGGKSALEITKNLMPFFGGNVVTDFSLPSFHQNFQDGKIADEQLAADFVEKVQIFQKAI